MNISKSNLSKKVESLVPSILTLDQILTPNVNAAHMRDQISRSATSVGANLAEASRSQSYKDYIHKIHVADKEASETDYWLRMFKAVSIINDEAAFKRLCNDWSKVVAVFEEIADADPNMYDHHND